MENQEFIKIYTSNLSHQIEIAKAILLDSEIESFAVDKKDSMYIFGDIELYVKPADELQARLILTQNNL